MLWNALAQPQADEGARHDADETACGHQERDHGCRRRILALPVRSTSTPLLVVATTCPTPNLELEKNTSCATDVHPAHCPNSKAGALAVLRQTGYERGVLPPPEVMLAAPRTVVAAACRPAGCPAARG